MDLDGLDAAWKKFGHSTQKKPVVYLACGDVEQAEKFVAAGAERGWEVTHKWKLLQDDPSTTEMVNSLAFDFQGAVDLAVMIRANFFFGITGSAFSTTISQLRDPTGRYRGSSLLLPDDAGARTHLFFDGDSGGYPVACDRTHIERFGAWRIWLLMYISDDGVRYVQGWA